MSGIRINSTRAADQVKGLVKEMNEALYEAYRDGFQVDLQINNSHSNSSSIIGYDRLSVSISVPV